MKKLFSILFILLGAILFVGASGYPEIEKQNFDLSIDHADGFTLSAFEISPLFDSDSGFAPGALHEPLFTVDLQGDQPLLYAIHDKRHAVSKVNCKSRAPPTNRWHSHYSMTFNDKS